MNIGIHGLKTFISVEGFFIEEENYMYSPLYILIIYNTTPHNNLVSHHKYHVNSMLKVKRTFSSKKCFLEIKAILKL